MDHWLHVLLVCVLQIFHIIMHVLQICCYKCNDLNARYVDGARSLNTNGQEDTSFGRGYTSGVDEQVEGLAVAFGTNL